ncbi:hypothetical protein QYF36_009192 [Acer negundo]|nr:hypothetical protein QYF36_009192 [Acer negundo]
MPFTFSSTVVYFIGLLLLGALIILPTIHTQEDAPQYYLDAHNSARAKVGVGPMTWNETLATYAEKYVSTRVADCTREYSGGPYGENLIANGLNRSSSISGTDIMNIWVAEKANYDLRSNACVAGRSCRNYTQVVWQNSRSLGCAKVRCSDGGYFFSCNYDPPGNLIGQRPFEINESAPTPEPVLAPSPAHTEDRRKAIGLVAGLIAGASAIILLGLVFVWFFLRWKRKQKETTYPVFDVPSGNEFENGTGPRKFSYRELAIGLWCAHPARSLRPSIRQAIQGLNFELPLPNLPSKMPVPNYDVPSSSTPAPAPTAMSGRSELFVEIRSWFCGWCGCDKISIADSLSDLEPKMLDIQPNVETVAVNAVFELHGLFIRPGGIEKVVSTVLVGVYSTSIDEL